MDSQRAKSIKNFCHVPSVEADWKRKNKWLIGTTNVVA